MSEPLDVIAHSYRSLVDTLHALALLQEDSRREARRLFLLALCVLSVSLGVTLGAAGWLSVQHAHLQREALAVRKQELLFQETLLRNTQTIAAQVQALAPRTP